MAGFRLKGTILGLGILPSTDTVQLTIQLGPVCTSGPIILMAPAADVASFSIGQNVFLDIALNSGEQATIAVADPVTPFDTTN